MGQVTRSVVAAAIDGETGEVFRQRLSPDHEQIEAWIAGLPHPVKVTYESAWVFWRALLGRDGIAVPSC